ncbi:MAG: cell division protein ZapA [Ruminococcaceae bacterium]|nr:cell division protein ZapA [Oscillospiraceae bacterium]
MENHVTVSICGEEYTLVAEEAPSYMQKVGKYVDAKLSELINTAKVGRSDAAVLTAVNIADEYFKEHEAAEKLRVQLKQYLDEANQAKNEVSALKRELVQLQNQKSKKQ